VTTIVDWHFCPHCETQLDAVTFICPACRWDPLAPKDEAANPEAGLSLTERYRGTQYSTSVAPSPAMADAVSPPQSSSKVRTFILVGFLLLLGMYGSMLVYTDFQNRTVDQPATLLDH
jgi:hypothetical protein